MDAVLTEIKTGKMFGQLIEEARSISDQNERQNFKRNNLPFFTIGEFKNNRRMKNALIQTQFAILFFNWIDSAMKNTLIMVKNQLIIGTQILGAGQLTKK